MDIDFAFLFFCVKCKLSAYIVKLSSSSVGCYLNTVVVANLWKLICIEQGVHLGHLERDTQHLYTEGWLVGSIQASWRLLLQSKQTKGFHWV